MNHPMQKGETHSIQHHKEKKLHENILLLNSTIPARVAEPAAMPG